MMKMAETAVFVYGTLKRGLKYHRDYIPSGLRIRDAWCWGRLYGLPEGYPALEIPEECILGEGSRDPAADSDRLSRISGGGLSDSSLQFAGSARYDPIVRPAGEWDRIKGELIILNDPSRQLPLLDELEEFIPGGNGLYRRVIYPAHTEEGLVPSWIYEYLRPHQGRRITDGSWPPG